MFAAVGIGAAYWLTLRDPAWLWVASGLLVVHWLGDSLDGTLARVRRIERPKYGYYLDHLVDAGATIVIGVGLGLSPYMSLVTGLAIVIAYLALSINTYLETQVFGVFSLGYGRFGPTEARVGLIVLNLALLAGATFQVAGQGLIDLVGLGAAGLMLAALGVRAARNLRVLAAREPAGVGEVMRGEGRDRPRGRRGLSGNGTRRRLFPPRRCGFGAPCWGRKPARRPAAPFPATRRRSDYGSRDDPCTTAAGGMGRSVPLPSFRRRVHDQVHLGRTAAGTASCCSRLSGSWTAPLRRVVRRPSRSRFLRPGSARSARPSRGSRGAHVDPGRDQPCRGCGDRQGHAAGSPSGHTAGAEHRGRHRAAARHDLRRGPGDLGQLRVVGGDRHVRSGQAARGRAPRSAGFRTTSTGRRTRRYRWTRSCRAPREVIVNLTVTFAPRR